VKHGGERQLWSLGTQDFMGIIDSNKFQLTCPKCGKVELVAVQQKGSSFGASWQSGPDPVQFVAEWSEDKVGGPVITNATCRACGSSAKVEGPS